MTEICEHFRLQRNSFAFESRMDDIIVEKTNMNLNPEVVILFDLKPSSSVN
jgi:hypothetical protein